MLLPARRPRPPPPSGASARPPGRARSRPGPRPRAPCGSVPPGRYRTGSGYSPAPPAPPPTSPGGPPRRRARDRCAHLQPHRGARPGQPQARPAAVRRRRPVARLRQAGRLADRRASTCAPSRTHSRCWRPGGSTRCGCRVSCTAGVAGDRGAGPAGPRRRPGSALVRTPALAHRAEAELEAAFAEDPAPLASLDWWRHCSERRAPRPNRRSPTGSGRRWSWSPTGTTTPVPVSAWHGDWTPWNMAPGRREMAPGRRGAALLVWDWERVRDRGAVRHGCPALRGQRRHPPARRHRGRGAERAAGDRRRGQRQASTGASTGAAYLVAITSRYLEMSGAPGGGLIVPRAVTALELLEEWVRVR